MCCVCVLRVSSASCAAAPEPALPSTGKAAVQLLHRRGSPQSAAKQVLHVTDAAAAAGKDSRELIKYFEAIQGVPKIEEGINPATWMLEVSC